MATQTKIPSNNNIIVPVSLVRPYLEYGSQVWDPHLTKDKMSLENVQKFACRIASASWDTSYEDLATEVV